MPGILTHPAEVAGEGALQCELGVRQPGAPGLRNRRRNEKAFPLARAHSSVVRRSAAIERTERPEGSAGEVDALAENRVRDALNQSRMTDNPRPGSNHG